MNVTINSYILRHIANVFRIKGALPGTSLNIKIASLNTDEETKEVDITLIKKKEDEYVISIDFIVFHEGYYSKDSITVLRFSNPDIITIDTLIRAFQETIHYKDFITSSDNKWISLIIDPDVTSGDEMYNQEQQYAKMIEEEDKKIPMRDSIGFKLYSEYTLHGINDK